MMEGCIKQNNGIDIYVEYFEEKDEGTECEAPHARTVGWTCSQIQIFWDSNLGLYRDPEQIDGHVRPVADISFKMDGQE